MNKTHQKTTKTSNPLRLISSETLAKKNIQHRWLIEGILAAGQTAVIGGPQKCHKTSIAIDMALSLGMGKPFLNRFPVPRRHRVALFSGESGQESINDTIRRICLSKRIKFEECRNNFWQFQLPKFSCDKSLSHLETAIQREEIEVVFIDPLYLCLNGDGRTISPSNVYEIGPALQNMATAVMKAGATPVLVHHTTKTAAKAAKTSSVKPPSLDDLAYAGIGEFSRQWFILRPLQEFDSTTGTSKYLFAVAGSAGHAMTRELTIVEGKMQTDFSGRKWSVSVGPHDDEETA